MALCATVCIMYNVTRAEIAKRHKNFNEKVLTWVAVYGTIYVFYTIRRLTCLCQWCWMNDPRVVQAKLQFYTFVIVNTAEVAWFVYGNFLFYSNVFDKRDADMYLWKFMLCIVIYGYIAMAIYIFSCLAITGMICILSAWGTFNKDMVANYETRLEQGRKIRDELALGHADSIAADGKVAESS